MEEGRNGLEKVRDSLSPLLYRLEHRFVFRDAIKSLRPKSFGNRRPKLLKERYRRGKSVENARDLVREIGRFSNDFLSGLSESLELSSKLVLRGLR
jgi:hypothetical protein